MQPGGCHVGALDPALVHLLHGRLGLLYYVFFLFLFVKLIAQFFYFQQGLLHLRLMLPDLVHLGFVHVAIPLETSINLVILNGQRVVLALSLNRAYLELL